MNSFLKLVFLSTIAAFSAFGQIGIQAGLGNLSSFGVIYQANKSLTVDFNYYSLSVTSGYASASLTKPELNAKYHVFQGSFYVGLGIGQMTVSADATDPLTNDSVEGSITTLTVTPNIGWNWGIDDGGFFGGLEFGYQIPQGGEADIDSTLPITNDAYQDLEDAFEVFAETSLPIITFFRFGYIF